ncbi:MAG: hypothetical protein Q6366_012515 [Candidatus Freyarchaeota archaeon]
MSERTTGTIIGGVLALIGALMGFYAGILLLAFNISTILNPPTLWAIIVFIGSLLALIFAIMLLVGKAIKWSAILLIIAGILSLLGFAGGGWWSVIAGLLEIIGAIIALLLKK